MGSLLLHALKQLEDRRASAPVAREPASPPQLLEECAAPTATVFELGGAPLYISEPLAPADAFELGFPEAVALDLAADFYSLEAFLAAAAAESSDAAQGDSTADAAVDEALFEATDFDATEIVAAEFDQPSFDEPRLDVDDTDAVGQQPTDLPDPSASYCVSVGFNEAPLSITSIEPDSLVLSSSLAWADPLPDFDPIQVLETAEELLADSCLPARSCESAEPCSAAVETPAAEVESSKAAAPPAPQQRYTLPIDAETVQNYASLARSIAAAHSGDCCTLLLVRAEASSGDAFSTPALALALRQIDPRPILLLDGRQGGLAHPVMSPAMAASSPSGLAAGEFTVADAAVPTTSAGIDVLPLASVASGKHQGQAFDQLWPQLHERPGFVLIDVAELDGLATALAPNVAGVYLLVSLHATKRRVAAQTLETLRGLGASICGTVISAPAQASVVAAA